MRAPEPVADTAVSYDMHEHSAALEHVGLRRERALGGVDHDFLHRRDDDLGKLVVRGARWLALLSRSVKSFAQFRPALEATLVLASGGEHAAVELHHVGFAACVVAVERTRIEHVHRAAPVLADIGRIRRADTDAVLREPCRGVEARCALRLG
jgi:hypothetical protein